MALPVWALFMKKVYPDSTLMYSPKDVFRIPPGQEYDCQAHQADSTTVSKGNESDEHVFDAL